MASAAAASSTVPEMRGRAPPTMCIVAPPAREGVPTA
jgi:hypothetical protein